MNARDDEVARSSTSRESDSKGGLSRRKFLTGAAAGIGAAALAAACGPGGSGSGTSSAGSGSPAVTSGKRKVLRVWDYVPEDFPTSQTLVEQLVPRFKDEHPNIDVEFTWNVPLEDFGRQFIQAAELGEAPDVFFNYYSRGELASLDYLHPLDEMFDELGIKEDFYPGALEQVQIGGSTIMIPGLWGVKCPMYRKDFLEEAGFDPETAPTSWEEFAEVAERTTVRDSSGRIVRDGFPWYIPGRADEYSEKVVVAILQAGGSEFMGDDPAAKSGLSTDQARQGFSWHLDLIREHECQAKTGPLTTDEPWPLPAGIAAIDLQGPWWLPAMRTEYPDFNADELLMIGPPLENAEKVGLGVTQGYSINGKSDLLEEAVTFGKLFLDDQIYADFHGQGVTYPTARRSINTSSDFWMSDDPLLQPGSTYVESFEHGGNVGLNHLAYAEIFTTVYNRMVERGLAGDGEDAQILADAASSVDEITATRERELQL